MTNKSLRGQFFTTNADYILSNFSIYIKNKEAVDPFAGNKDLIFWAKKHKVKSIKGFDIDNQYADNKLVCQNDSINNPGQYKFIITNPPYLHKNKATAEVKQKFFNGHNQIFEDLYQVSISSLMSSEEGIIIVPVNFLSAENSAKIRKIFFAKFEIISLNLFTEQVFNDTTYNVISFYYRIRKNAGHTNKFTATIFPDKKKINIELTKQDGWQIGGKFTNLINSTKNDLGITRLTEEQIIKGNKDILLAYNNINKFKKYKVSDDFKKLLKKNIILLRAIDSKNNKKIQLEDIRNYKTDALVGKQSSRNMAYLLFKDDISIDTQLNLIRSFNKELEKNRYQYNSLFLTNFRDNNRKRIGFDFAYKLINYVFKNIK